MTKSAATESAKYLLPFALYMLSNSIQADGAALFLQVLWVVVQLVEIGVMAKVRGSISALPGEEDPTRVRVLKPQPKKKKKKGTKKKDKEKEKEKAATNDEGAVVADAPAPAPAPTPAPAPAPAPTAATAPPAPEYEELTIREYDTREFSKLVTRWVIELLFIGLFNFAVPWLQASAKNIQEGFDNGGDDEDGDGASAGAAAAAGVGGVGSLGLLYGVVSGPLAFIDSPLVRVHIFGADESRPFDDQQKGVFAEVKGQVDELNALRKEARLGVDREQLAKDTELVNRLQQRRGGGRG
jgi:hypothetical protein